jgi:hypothetical protein
VRLSAERLDRYAIALATYLYSIGAELDAEIPRLEEADDGGVGVFVGGRLPDDPGDGSGDGRARIDVTEHWAPDGDALEQVGYLYELLDHAGDRRRAFHRHDDVVFLRAFGVAVHEHCEEPIGMAPCEHVAGLPKRDGFEAINDLLVAWSTSSGRPICAELRCLE